MKIILLEKIENLGQLGDLVQVKSGYARNYLVPKGKAKYATEENLKEFETIKDKLIEEQNKIIAEATARKNILDGVTINITSEANEEGQLFGSISNIDIMKLLEEKGHSVERKEIRMPEGSIKSIGEYQINIHLGIDTESTVNLIVEPNK